MTADGNSDKTCFILLLLLLQSKNWVGGGGGGGKNHNFWNFTDFSLGYIEKKSCNFWSFRAVLYEISQNASKDIIRTHN